MVKNHQGSKRVAMEVPMPSAPPLEIPVAEAISDSITLSNGDHVWNISIHESGGLVFTHNGKNKTMIDNELICNRILLGDVPQSRS